MFYSYSQLVVKDGFKQAGMINKVLAKNVNIVSYVWRSIRANDILEGEKRLQAKVVTRWNSELKSIRSFLNIPEEKLGLLASPQLSEYERSLLKDLVEILTPFEEVTYFTQKQNYVSVGFIIPGIRGLRKAIEMMNVKYNSEMLSTLKNSLNRIIEIYEQRELYIYAAILDTRFKFDRCNGSELLRIEARFRYFLSSRSTLISDPLISDSSQSPPQRGEDF